PAQRSEKPRRRVQPRVHASFGRVDGRMGPMADPRPDPRGLSAGDGEQAARDAERVRSAFFASVSDELRAPLALMVVPLAEALADPDEPLGETQRERIELAH